MKSIAVLLLLLPFIVQCAWAQSAADDQYIGICSQIERANRLAVDGDPGEALAAYSDAQMNLQRFRKIYRDWNPTIVNFRLNQLSTKIAEIQSRINPAAAILKTNSTPTVMPASPAPLPDPAVRDLNPRTQEAEIRQAELDGLRAELQSEQAANRQLQAKLKEAIALRPAETDPREMARAQEKIRALMKKNDLLMAVYSRTATSMPEARTITNVVVVTNVTTLIVTNRGAIEVTNLADVFVRNKEPMIVTNVVFVTNHVRTVVLDTNALEILQLERAAAVRNFNDEHARSEELAAELKRLRQAPAPGAAAGSNELAALNALRAENLALKEEIGRLRTAPPSREADTNLVAELRQARARISSLESEAQIAALEKAVLQRKLKALIDSTNTTVSAAAYETRIRELTAERNDLIGRLDRAGKQKPAGSADDQSRIAELDREVNVLRARLVVAEAQPVPYTKEELALMKSGPVSLRGKPDSSQRSIKEMPAGTLELIHSAQGHFMRREYDKAEADYLKILSRDEANAVALANLATIELQQGKLSEAEKHITAALKSAPDDPYTISTYGKLKVQQNKYREALDYLSRAAQLEPNNPETQNFLGLALSHLGQRKSAETALRRAIQLAPDYGSAHNNLATAYLTQETPSPALARWHYQRSLECGLPRNPELEKLLAEKGAPVQ